MVRNRDGRNQANRGQTNPNESWRIWTKPNEPGKMGKIGQKISIFREKWGKTGQKQAKMGERKN